LKDFECLFSLNVDKIIQINSENKISWEIISKEKKYGPYDCLIFGTPAYNIAKIMKNSFENNDDNQSNNELIKKLENVSYKKIYSLAISFEGIFNFPFYALINSDREHSISWISIENDKIGHVTKENQTVLIVQMNEEFSDKFSDTEINPNEVVLDKIINEIKNLLPELINSKILYSYLKLWRLALPKNSIDLETIQKLAEKNLFVIGDSTVGKGRLDGAMLSGFELYDQLKANF
jgi:predicted NAD/FAD-dependent oxidoreductase